MAEIGARRRTSEPTHFPSSPGAAELVAVKTHSVAKLFRAPPVENARTIQLLVERVDVKEDALEARIRTKGLASLIGTAAAWRKDGGMIQSAETRLHARGAHPDAVPASRRTQAHRRERRQPDPASNKPQPDGTLVKALARAWRWQKVSTSTRQSPKRRRHSPWSIATITCSGVAERVADAWDHAAIAPRRFAIQPRR